jgi:hypothetical protein
MKREAKGKGLERGATPTSPRKYAASSRECGALVEISSRATWRFMLRSLLARSGLWSLSFPPPQKGWRYFYERQSALSTPRKGYLCGNWALLRPDQHHIVGTDNWVTRHGHGFYRLEGAALHSRAKAPPI